MKTWGKPGNCVCDHMEKLNCTHSYTYSILHQHFPDHGETHIQQLMELLDTITTQTCDSSNHVDLPMHGPSKYIKEPMPTYEKMQQLHQQLNPDLTRSDPTGTVCQHNHFLDICQTISVPDTLY